MLANAERTTDRRAERHPSVRSQQKLALATEPTFLSWRNSVSPFNLVIAWGAVTILGFDVLDALASRPTDIAYGFPAYGSYLLVTFIGYFAAKSGGMRAAFLAGVVMGVIDATVGRAVSLSIVGFGRARFGGLSFWNLAAAVALCVIFSAFSGAIGGIIERVRRPASAPLHAP